MRVIAIASAVLLMAASTAAAQVFPEPGALTRGIEWAADRFNIDESGRAAKRGFFVASGKTVAGSGWIAGGGGYRQYLFGERAFVEGSGGASVRLYKTAQAKFEIPRLGGRGLAVGSQVLWQDLTQVAYFGTGPDSLDTMRSQYRVHYLDAIAYASAEASDTVTVHATLGVLRRPHIGAATGPFRRDLPDTRDLFPDEPAFQPAAIARFRHAGIGVVADRRDHPGYPSRGGLYRAAWNSYWGPADSVLGFHRIEAEGLQFVPLVGEWWSVALHGWGLFTDTSEGRYVPFYMMGTLGGQTLRGYHAYRFADKNFLLTSIESRVRLTTHLDGAVFVDAGNVAAFARDLDLARRAYGFGVRLHTQTATLARLDVARGGEGWRLAFSMNDPFRLSRAMRRAPQLPFHP